MNTAVQKYVVDEKSTGKTAEQFLRNEKGVSRRLLVKLKREPNGLTRNGEPIRSIDVLKTGDVVEISLADTKTLAPNPSLAVPIIYEDESVVVFDKPSGMPVHPSIKHQGDTLGNFFAEHCKGKTFRPINRLDRDTTGLCVVAKTAHSANLLQKRVEKVYFAVVQGKVDPPNGTISAPIARESDSIIMRCVRNDGQEAVTNYHTIWGNEELTFLRITLQTGRTHQIRVHFSHIGNPLAGDEMYGGAVEKIGRQALHCGEVSFLHPETNEEIKLVADVPQDMRSLLR